ncbi:MAG TPA: hypothetical protein PLX89_14235 [Verrucomicrobiota bacterium]|nr:hypothetical protein [Verrucomicrobiota bacterium]
MRRSLAANLTNLNLALAVTRRCLKRGREEADPRYLGQAQVALEPWSDDANPPVEVLVLRATLHQSLHHFETALAELGAALVRDPRNVQAWLTKATIHTVRADFAEARHAAVRLLPLTDELTATTAVAQIASVCGQGAGAIAQLKTVLAETQGRSDFESRAEGSQRLWAETVLAETLARLGHVPAAETHFKEGLKLAPRDPYLLGAYADFLLDQNRLEEVAELLGEHKRIDGLLLRWTEATRSESGIEELASRFEAARARGDRVHLREEARFELRLRKRSAVALALAKENWQVQREPADARLLIEAARAISDHDTEDFVLDWAAQTKLEDVALRSNRSPTKVSANTSSRGEPPAIQLGAGPK